MPRGGKRPNAGRPLGAREARLSVEETRARLVAVAGDGPNLGARAARILGVSRQQAARWLADGVTVRTAETWHGR